MVLLTIVVCSRDEVKARAAAAGTTSRLIETFAKVVARRSL